MSNLKKILAASLISSFVTMSAQAVQYGFAIIDGLDNTDVGGQLFVDVVQSGANVTFNFSNVGPTASSVTDIYFDDDALMSALLSFNEGAGVNFSAGASPGNLPGGNSLNPDFEATAALSSDSDAPVSSNGIGIGETLGITFSLVGGKTFNDVLLDLDSGDLRIGLHVQAIAPQGGSDAYVNTTTVPVPDATATIMLLGAAVMGLGLFGRKIA